MAADRYTMSTFCVHKMQRMPSLWNTTECQFQYQLQSNVSVPYWGVLPLNKSHLPNVSGNILRQFHCLCLQFTLWQLHQWIRRSTMSTILSSRHWWGAGIFLYQLISLWRYIITLWLRPWGQVVVFTSLQRYCVLCLITMCSVLPTHTSVV